MGFIICSPKLEPSLKYDAHCELGGEIFVCRRTLLSIAVSLSKQMEMPSITCGPLNKAILYHWVAMTADSLRNILGV
jgi:hypothetical protein